VLSFLSARCGRGDRREAKLRDQVVGSSKSVADSADVYAKS